MKGLDSYGAMPPALLKGYGFIMRYVSQQKGKCVVPAEVPAYHGAKVALGLVYEDQAEDALGGAGMGTLKARLALPILQSLNWPITLPVYFAVDMPGYAADLPTFVACAKAFAEGINRPVAIYGDVDTCTAAHAAGIKYLWQFGEGRAPGITIIQSPSTTLGGFNIDPDESLAPDFGQWAPAAPKPPAPKPEEEDMPLLVTGTGGTTYVVAADLTSKVGLPKEADVTSLEATGLYKTATLDQALLTSIPTVA